MLFVTLRTTFGASNGGCFSLAVLTAFTLLSSGAVESRITNSTAEQDSRAELPSPPAAVEKYPGLNRRRNLDGNISLKELDWLNYGNGETVSFSIDRIPAEQPEIIPQCSNPDYLFDPNTDACWEPGTQAHCGENMVFRRSDGYNVGGCWCSVTRWSCWGRPLVLAGDRCNKVATRGPCPLGQTIVAVNRFNVECRADACLSIAPRYAINFSKVARRWRDQQQRFPDESDEPFLFTHRNECYLTETEAFCEPGKVARFMHPYKSPFCVPRNYVTCIKPTEGAVGAPVKGTCEPGLMEDRVRNVCVPSAMVDFQ